MQVQHYPYYFTAGKGDYRGNECMRQTYEPLFYQYGVDVSMSGASSVFVTLGNTRLTAWVAAALRSGT